MSDKERSCGGGLGYMVGKLVSGQLLRFDWCRQMCKCCQRAGLLTHKLH